METNLNRFHLSGLYSYIVSYSDTPPIRQKALISRLFKMTLVQSFLDFREQSYTLNMMRLRKQINRLHFLQLIA